VLLDGARKPESLLARALDTAMTAAADQTFRDVVREAIGKRDAIDTWVARAGDLQAAVADLSALLSVDSSDSIDDIEAEYFSGTIIAPVEWPAIAKVLARGGANDCAQAERFASLTALSGSERVDRYLGIFCTSGDRTPRKSIVSKAIDDAALVQRLIGEQQRVCALLARRRAVFSRDRSAALLTVAHAVLTHYDNEKERRGLLDYDDLIDKTLALLSNFDAAWVHYKLDLGIDHVLVDEAQDTSSKQWEIVRRLTAEFTAGEGARSLTRTMFAVGDEKQSIYSFQDAAPKEFAEMQRYFKNAHEKSGLAFVVSRFEYSFRSGAAILEAVDAVFMAKDVAASVTSDQAGFPPHIALPNAPPSMVEIWEPEKPDPRDENKEGWDAPFDTVSETSPRVKLARRIARTVRRLVDKGAASYGDVLVLVRQRGELFEAIIRALKNQRIDVAGADRLMLTEHIAVMDMMALADALLLPEDDLALATVLRSPLFDVSDDDLFEIAWDRGRLPLRAALIKKAAEKPRFAEAAVRLDELAQAARRETPFGFYALLLGEGGARRRFLSRLGPEANDAIDEFLNVAFDYERRETPSLQGFLTWLRDARAEVKRDMEIRRDEVRVMTVHGAKGLEASMVILADTITPPVIKPPRLLQLAEGATIWAGRKADDVDKVAEARTLANTETEHEYRRLLYVAMTRAADRLIICGADGVNQRPKTCWYNLVYEPLKPLLVEEDDGGDKVWRYRKPSGAALAPTQAAERAGSAMPREVPPWLRRRASPVAPRMEWMAPSAAFEDEIGRTFARTEGSIGERRKSLQRGRIVHRLMQSAPDIPQAVRKAAIEHYLKTTAIDFSSTEQTEIAQQALAILNDLVFADVFASGSRAEVPIVGRIARDGDTPIGVSGQVDRLAVTRDSVVIADYKTDRAVPHQAAEIPPAYVAQLALYRAVLSRIYPNRTIRAALLYTAGPRLIDVPGTAMDAELAKITGQIAGQVTAR